MSISELEKQFQDSVKEAAASVKRRENIHEPTLEQKAKALDIFERLSKLHDELIQKSNLARKIEINPENMNAHMIEYLHCVQGLLDECATEADRLRIKIEHSRTSEDFAKTVQLSRREDLATMIHYLDKVSQQVSDLVTRYETDLEKQAAHRQKEAQTLDHLNVVLDQYHPE